jgi:hypothetical protein
VLVFLAVAPSDSGVARPFDWTGAALNALAFGFVIAGVATLGVGGPSLAAGGMTVGDVRLCDGATLVALLRQVRRRALLIGVSRNMTIIRDLGREV